MFLSTVILATQDFYLLLSPHQAGDSRLYHFREGQLLYQTADHSIIQLLLEMGKIQPEDIPRHPMRAIVNSCLGGKNGQGDFSVDPKWQEENPPIIHLKTNEGLLNKSANRT